MSFCRLIFAVTICLEWNEYVFFSAVRSIARLYLVLLSENRTAYNDDRSYMSGCQIGGRFCIMTY